MLFKTNDFDIDVFDADTFSCILFCGKNDAVRGLRLFFAE